MTEQEVLKRYAEAAKVEGYDPDPTKWKPGPGRFEAEPAEVLYYDWDTGSGEITYPCEDCEYEQGDENCEVAECQATGEIFDVDPAEAKVFGIKTKRIMLTFSDQGFLGIVYMS